MAIGVQIYKKNAIPYTPFIYDEKRYFYFKK